VAIGSLLSNVRKIRGYLREETQIKYIQNTKWIGFRWKLLSKISVFCNIIIYKLKPTQFGFVNKSHDVDYLIYP